jgi:hypothetical protein
MPLELIVGAAVGAAAASPTVRKAIRTGLVIGVGNALIAYDKVAAVARGVADGARKGVSAAVDGAPQATPAPPAAPAAEAAPAVPRPT